MLSQDGQQFQKVCHLLVWKRRIHLQFIYKLNYLRPNGSMKQWSIKFDTDETITQSPEDIKDGHTSGAADSLLIQQYVAVFIKINNNNKI